MTKRAMGLLILVYGILAALGFFAVFFGAALTQSNLSSPTGTAGAVLDSVGFSFIAAI